MTGGWERSPGEEGGMTQLICQPACYPDEGPKHLLQTGAVLLIKPRETKIANPTKVRFATWERQLAAVLNENETELKTRVKRKRTPQSEVHVLDAASRCCADWTKMKPRWKRGQKKKRTPQSEVRVLGPASRWWWALTDLNR